MQFASYRDRAVNRYTTALLAPVRVSSAIAVVVRALAKRQSIARTRSRTFEKLKIARHSQNLTVRAKYNPGASYHKASARVQFRLSPSGKHPRRLCEFFGARVLFLVPQRAFFCCRSSRTNSRTR